MMFLNYLIGFLGILCMLIVLISAITTPIFFLLWILAQNEKSTNKFMKLTFISAGSFPAALVLLVILFFAFGFSNIMAPKVTEEMTYEEFIEEYSDDEESEEEEDEEYDGLLDPSEAPAIIRGAISE